MPFFKGDDGTPGLPGNPGEFGRPGSKGNDKHEITPPESQQHMK